jgi:hypothetical protein
MAGGVLLGSALLGGLDLSADALLGQLAQPAGELRVEWLLGHRELLGWAYFAFFTALASLEEVGRRGQTANTLGDS